MEPGELPTPAEVAAALAVLMVRMACSVEGWEVIMAAVLAVLDGMLALEPEGIRLSALYGPEDRVEPHLSHPPTWGRK